MSDRIEALPWDSDFFDLSIGRVSLDGVTDDDLVAIGEEARDRGFDCVYGTMDASRDETNASVRAQMHGHLLVDQSILLRRPEQPYEPLPTPSVARPATEDDIEMISGIIPVIAPWSRYGADPRFGIHAATRMWEAWVERGIREDDRMISVTEDDDGITGLGTQSIHGPTGVPCFDSATVNKPGQGVSAALFQIFIEWAPPGETTAGWCAARNIAVLRFLERHGYNVGLSRYSFHWWKDGSSYA